jgi:hypothetical protein
VSPNDKPTPAWMSSPSATAEPLTPKYVRHFLLEASHWAADKPKQLTAVHRVPEDYRSVMREHYRTIAKMEAEDPTFVALTELLNSPDGPEPKNAFLSMWYWTLLKHNMEGLLTTPNLGEYLLQGIKHKDPIMEKVIQTVEDRLDEAENHVVIHETVAELIVMVDEASSQGRVATESFTAEVRPLKDKVDTLNERKNSFGLPFTDAWVEAFGDDCAALRLLGSEEGLAIFTSASERQEALRNRDDAADKVTVPWTEAMQARDTAQLKDRQATEAAEARATRLAKRKAQQAAIDAAVAKAAAEAPQVPRSKQPPVHPDLADAIEMVNVVDAPDRIEALKDLRETALVVTLENPGDVQAERWASWAKEQMRLARRPDTEWSVIDGQFRSCSFQPNNRNEKEDT